MAMMQPVTSSPGDSRRHTADEVKVRVAVARRAQPAFAALGVEKRAAIMRRALDLLLERQEHFIDVIVRETGRSRMETLLMELFPACDSLAYYAKHAGRLLRDESPSLHLLKTKKLVISYRPLGVIGVITPWNGPFVLALNPTVQALMAGNAVVLKPSEVTPVSGKLVLELLTQAGLPEGVLQVVEGDGETGAAVVASGVDKISFTGSVATGRKIGEVCGRNLVPCTLELGGKNPSIVCADADIGRAAKGSVVSAYLNAGQFCCATARIYVMDSVADAFTSQLLDYVKTLKQGTSGDFDLGRVIWPRQLEVIERHVNDAVTRGARVLTGGARNREVGELYYQPTVLTDVNADMQVMREETFGPVLSIVRVRDEAEAIRLANDTPYGLAATIWTRDQKKALELARQIEAGHVCMNDTSLTYGIHEAPFGGRKQSGLGQVHGPNGLKNYCYAQSIVLERFKAGQEEAWYPYTQQKAEAMRKVMRLVFGSKLGRMFT